MGERQDHPHLQLMIAINKASIKLLYQKVDCIPTNPQLDSMKRTTIFPKITEILISNLKMRISRGNRRGSWVLMSQSNDWMPLRTARYFLVPEDSEYSYSATKIRGKIPVPAT
jgi:hypothetical protein